MDIETFETVSLYVGMTVLIVYMFFIMWKLTKDTDAGKFGGMVIFGTLGLGVMGFIIKEVLIVTMDM